MSGIAYEMEVREQRDEMIQALLHNMMLMVRDVAAGT